MKKNPLAELFEEKLARAGECPPPLEMGIRPPRREGFVDAAAVRRKILATRRKVNRFLRKYMKGK